MTLVSMNLPLAQLNDGTGASLLDAAIKGALLLFAAGLAAMALRSRSASHRHVIWGVAMLGLMLLPIASLCVPGRPIQILPRNTSAQPRVTQSLAQARSDSQPASGNETSWTRRLMILWAAGTAGCMLLVLLDMLALKWFAARAVQITSGPWLETFDQVRRESASRPVMLLEQHGAGMPLACGVFAPTLVLPADAAAWPSARRRVVLEHELAHVRRRDCATQLLARLACAIHWFNPLAWFALRRMRVERERACDDRVVGGGCADPAEYASHLLEIARSLRAARFGALAGVTMARPSQLEGRLLAVLNDHQDRRPVSRTFVANTIIALFLVVGPLAAVRIAPRDELSQPAPAQLSAAKAPAYSSSYAPAPDAIPTSPLAATTQPQPASESKSKPPKFFPNGQKVEVKWGGQWRKAVVINHRGQWVLIDYDGNKFFREWVEPWRVRDIGSAYDVDGSVTINPSVHHNEGPPREKPGPPPENPAAHSATANDEPPMDVPVTQVDRDKSKLVMLDDLGAVALTAPDAGLALKAATAPMRLAGSTGEFFDHPESLLLSNASGIAAVMQTNAPPGNSAPQFRVERVNVITGQSMNVCALPLALEAFDLSPDGKLLLARPGVFGPGHGSRLDVWQVDGETAAHVVTFIPFTARTGSEQIVWARFIDNDHLLARSFDGELSCFAFRKAVLVWSAKPGLNNVNVLSPNRKYVAVTTDKQVAILDALSGKAMGGIDLPDRAWSIAFKPDGRQIAVGAPDSLMIYDLTTGALVADVSAVGASGQSIDWASEGYLLLDHLHLVAPAKQAVVWTYRGVAPTMHGELGACLNARLYYTADAALPGKPHRPVIASTALPDEAVRSLLAVVGDPKMALKPGMSITLEVNVDGTIQQQVIDALTARLKANGVTVAENQPVKLIVGEEPGETREISYRRIGFGSFGQVDKVSVQETKRSIEITGADGKVLWKRGGVLSPPMLISLKEGQSINEAIAEQMKPTAKFYDGIRIPRFVPKVPGGFGTSDLTASGAKPVKAAPGKERRA